MANANGVETFLAGIKDISKREDARALSSMMERLSGETPKMWGSSIVGFGQYHYRYESGREGDAMLIGFSPRANAMVLYVMDGFPRYQELLDRLGKHKQGKSCLYVVRLRDVDVGVLEELISASVDFMRRTYLAP